VLSHVRTRISDDPKQRRSTALADPGGSTDRSSPPDFQRGWVWDDNHIASLLASISMSYPIGAVMTLQTGNPDVRFRPRALEGVELKKPMKPEFMLLDGSSEPCRCTSR
jgi:Protein of unknown function DUF262